MKLPRSRHTDSRCWTSPCARLVTATTLAAKGRHSPLDGSPDMAYSREKCCSEDRSP
jgi:hypothetical protein